MTGRTTHYKPFSIVEGDIHVNINLSRFERQMREAQYELDGMVMESMDPYIPKGAGILHQKTKGISGALQGTGRVCAAAPVYGRFLYEGKGMVDQLTGSPIARRDTKKVLVSQYKGKTNARENLTYSNAKTVPHWFDAAKKTDLKKWIKKVKETAGGG